MNQVGFKKIALAASIMLTMALTFGCSDDKEDNGSKKEKWCVGSLVSVDGYKACYKIGIKSQMLDIVVTEAYCNDYKPLMSVTEEAPDKAACGSIYEDEKECILYGYDTEMTMPCSDVPGSSSSSVPIQTGVIHGDPVDYQGETYQTVVIGTQTWMARNLNYNVSGSKCYDEDPANCAIYGRLYDWTTAMGIDAKYNNEEWDGSDVNHKGICPSGWHIPNADEWKKLEKFVGENAGTKLKATSGWNDNGNGTDDYSFSALPGGGGERDGSFSDVGREGTWWSSSADDDDSANGLSMNSYFLSESVFEYSGNKVLLNSVRCLKD